ncbi:MAG: hypothetical protein QOE63_1772 [Acidimicrobiaceae bacterium]
MDGQPSRGGARGSKLRGFGRTIAVGLISLALSAGAMLALASGAARADDTAFTNGTAVAQAGIVRIAPGVGSLGLATTTGTSLAHIANSLAEAQAQAADLGLIGTALTAQTCDGKPGALTPDQLPQPLTVDNRKGDASTSVDEAPIGSTTLGGGRKEVSADTVPSSHASVSGVATSIGSTVSISGGRSDARTTIDPGKSREADATASVDIDIAGLVQLHGAQWHAVHRTGADPAATGTFSVASTMVGGIPVPIEQLAPLQAAINQALVFTGITISLPQVQHITDPNDIMAVTPLRIELDDTPLGKTVLGPVLNATRVQREQILTQLYTAACQLEGAGLVADIGLDIISGTGFTIIDIGGVSASSAAVQYENPFGDQPAFIPPADATPTGPATGAAPSVSTSHGTPAVAGAAAKAGTTISQTGPLEAICETIHPAKRPACSAGMGVPIALLAVLLTAGFAVLDWRHQHNLVAADDPAVVT